jgi:hypothetical protein
VDRAHGNQESRLAADRKAYYKDRPLERIHLLSVFLTSLSVTKYSLIPYLLTFFPLKGVYFAAPASDFRCSK